MTTTAPAPVIDQFSRLQTAYDIFNSELFDDALPPAFLTMVNKPGSYGFFSPKKYTSLDGQIVDQISLDPTTATTRPLAELLSTLAHEMSHQAVYTRKGVTGGHGKEWRDLMFSIGLTPIRVGPSWKHATHRINPKGRFMQVFTKYESVLEALPWQEEVAPARKKAKKSDRTKFECPICSGLAWAKPSAHIGCFNSEHDPVEMIPEFRTTDGEEGKAEGPKRENYSEPRGIPGLPVFTDELGKELRLHTGLSLPPTNDLEAVAVMTFGLQERGFEEQLKAFLEAEPKTEVYAQNLKVIYKVRCLQLHPDTGGSEVSFKAMQTAYCILSS